MTNFTLDNSNGKVSRALVSSNHSSDGQPHTFTITETLFVYRGRVLQLDLFNPLHRPTESQIISRHIPRHADINSTEPFRGLDLIDDLVLNGIFYTPKIEFNPANGPVSTVKLASIDQGDIITVPEYFDGDIVSPRLDYVIHRADRGRIFVVAQESMENSYLI